MENHWGRPGIAEVTLHAYTQRHGNDESNGFCWRPKAKPIAISILCTIIVSLAVYWFIVEPIFEYQKEHKGDNNRDAKNCQR